MDNLCNLPTFRLDAASLFILRALKMTRASSSQRNVGKLHRTVKLSTKNLRCFLYMQLLQLRTMSLQPLV